MSQNLTQPEEIDYALMEMAGHDMKTGTPVPDGVLLNGVRYECDEAIGVTGFFIWHGAKKIGTWLASPITGMASSHP